MREIFDRKYTFKTTYRNDYETIFHLQFIIEIAINFCLLINIDIEL